MVDLLRSRAVRILLLALILTLGVDLFAQGFSKSTPSTNNSSLLFIQPSEEGIYLLGNSMFKTGIDVDALETAMPNVAVDFEYHNGHYTNLWYLIAKSALGSTAEKPRLVVWGFRPRMALDPAFRQNWPNDTDLFAIDDDIYNDLKKGEDFKKPSLFSADSIRSSLEENTGLYPVRDEFQEQVQQWVTQTSFEILQALNVSSSSSLKRSILGDERSLADEIARLLTGGEIFLTEETVIDTKGDFIIGPQRGFNDGYIPATAEAIKANGIDQAIVIWRPVNVANGNSIPAEDSFVAEAINYFSKQNIPVINLYDNDEMIESYFASGDHYNALGRAYVTKLLAVFLTEILVEEHSP